MTRRSKRKKSSTFVDRETIAKAEGRFAKADKQRANLKADANKAVIREQKRAERFGSHKPKK